MPKRKDADRRARRADVDGLAEANRARQQAERNLDAAQRRHAEAVGIIDRLRAMRSEDRLAQRVRDALEEQPE